MIAIAAHGMMIQAQDVVKENSPKVDVYYFHGNMRCATCNAIEAQTRQTLEDSFADEVKSGTLNLHVLNLEDKENKDLVKQFEIGWSSLVLYVPKTGKSVNLTEMAFAKGRTNPEEFRAELEKQIRELL